MFHLIRPGTQYDFIGKWRLWASVSALAVLASLVLFFTKGLNYGIDFSGGAEIEVQVPTTWDIGKLRGVLEKGGLEEARVQEIGAAGSHQYLVKAQGDEVSLNKISTQVGEILGKNLKQGEYEILRSDVVGPAAGESLRKSGFLSMFYALLCILIYVAIRFDMRYAPGAIMALLHDALVTVGVFILLGKPFDLQILAAILALIGYSINDTIVIYDRIRENEHLHPNLAIDQVVNRSVNETLGRTLLTSLVTQLTVFCLWLFGGKVIHDFAFALMIGIVFGCYSTVFVASPMVVYMTHRQKRKAERMKTQGGASKRSVTVRPEPKLQS